MPKKKNNTAVAVIPPKEAVVHARIIDPQADADKEQKRLTIKRSKQYVQEILDMPADEAIKLLRDQVTTKLLLINDQILKWLEVLDTEQDWRKRTEAASHIQMLEKCAADVTSSKIGLDKALGMELLPHLPENALQVGEAPSEITPEAFQRLYEEETTKAGQVRVKPGHA